MIFPHYRIIFIMYYNLYYYILHILQDEYNRVRYEIVGDDNAPNYFSVNEDNGQIILRRSVNNDDKTEYKVMF